MSLKMKVIARTGNMGEVSIFRKEVEEFHNSHKIVGIPAISENVITGEVGTHYVGGGEQSFACVAYIQYEE